MGQSGVASDLRNRNRSGRGFTLLERFAIMEFIDMLQMIQMKAWMTLLLLNGPSNVDHVA